MDSWKASLLRAGVYPQRETDEQGSNGGSRKVCCLLIMPYLTVSHNALYWNSQSYSVNNITYEILTEYLWDFQFDSCILGQLIGICSMKQLTFVQSLPLANRQVSVPEVHSIVVSVCPNPTRFLDM